MLFPPVLTIELLALLFNYVDMKEVIETISGVKVRAVFLPLTLFF